MKIDKSKHPLILLEDFEKLIQELRTIVKESDELIVEEEGQKVDTESDSTDYEYLRFKFNNKNYDFYFTIDNIKLTTYSNGTNSPQYDYYKSPASDKTTERTTKWDNNEKIVAEFKDWRNLIKRYNSLDFKDPITESIEKEIYENFKIVDEGADTEPFSTEQQIFILRYLDASTKFLESKNEEFEVIEIIEEIEEFKNEVTRLPKNSTMKRLSSVLAKTKKQSISLFKELMSMIKKDLMKKVISEGHEYIDGLLKLMQNIGG